MNDDNFNENTFEKIKRYKRHGPHRARTQRFRLPRCNGKMSYRTEEKAEKQRESRMREQGLVLYVYRCPNCFYWHLTSQPQHKKK